MSIAALNRHGGGEVSQKYMSQIMISQHRMLVGQSWLENNSWRGSLGFVIITSVAPSSRLCCGDEAAILDCPAGARPTLLGDYRAANIEICVWP